MAKKESSFVNMVLTLFVVKAIGEVLPEFDSIIETKILPQGGKDSLTFYETTNQGEVVGTAIRTYTDEGFSGRFWIMVGFVNGDIISGTSVLEHKETPGLGDKMDKKKSDWSFQFKNKDLTKYKLSVTKDGGEVDAITAATISSRAFCDAIQLAYDELKKQEGE